MSDLTWISLNISLLTLSNAAIFISMFQLNGLRIVHMVWVFFCSYPKDSGFESHRPPIPVAAWRGGNGFSIRVIIIFCPPGANGVPIRVERWPYHQHPPGYAVWQPAGTEPHQSHRALLQSTGTEPGIYRDTVSSSGDLVGGDKVVLGLPSSFARQGSWWLNRTNAV